MNLSLFKTGKSNPAFNMALDEALLDFHARGDIGPVLRLYGWNPPALTIGYTQDWNDCVDHDACRRQGIPVVRRTTGGGAVFHDNELTYSIVAPSHDLGENILDSFRNVSRALIAGLDTLGIAAAFAPINDITVNGKKISGNAQIRRRGAILQHGTILIGLDREKMFSMLKISDEKLRRKNISDARERVTSAEEELDRKITYGEMEQAIISGFTDWAGRQLAIFEPPEEIIAAAGRIEKEKFANVDWNARRGCDKSD